MEKHRADRCGARDATKAAPEAWGERSGRTQHRLRLRGYSWLPLVAGLRRGDAPRCPRLAATMEVVEVPSHDVCTPRQRFRAAQQRATAIAAHVDARARFATEAPSPGAAADLATFASRFAQRVVDNAVAARVR